jgi:hypothetical protein
VEVLLAWLSARRLAATFVLLFRTIIVCAVELVFVCANGASSPLMLNGLCTIPVAPLPP